MWGFVWAHLADLKLLLPLVAKSDLFSSGRYKKDCAGGIGNGRELAAGRDVEGRVLWQDCAG